MNPQLDFFQPSRISSYYNTTGESEEKSRVYEQVARAQDDKIFSKISMGGQWTSEELHEIFPGMLLTSIRRALTNLSKGGWIEVAGKKVGKHQRNILIWKAKRQPM